MAAEEPSSDPADAPADLPRVAGSVKPVGVPMPSSASTHSGSAWKQVTETTSPSEPLVRYEHFEILRRVDGSPWELGRGGMGATYKALDTRLQHHVALKIISAELTSYPAARERFLREARTAARLHHPNVARVFHLGETASGMEAFYAMEFVEGETLEARVRRIGPLSVWLVVEIGIEVARALVAACHQNLIHRDLKPANLMLVASAEAATVAAVSAESGYGEANEAWVKVIDFGLAKAVAGAGPLTGVGDFIGTPVYASPEQFTGGVREVDGRSDIYSLGGTLWYALTGDMPFEGRSLTEIHAQKLTGAAPIVRLGAAGLPAPLVRLLASMLAADPGDRPQTPSILLEALRRCREELHLLSRVRPGQPATGSFSWKPLRTWRHRRIYQVCFGYAVGAWLLLQVTAIVLPGLGWPHWILRPVIVTLLAGFGEALLLGWALDRQAAGKARLPQRTSRRVGFVLLALAPAAGVAAFFLWQQPSPNDSKMVDSDPGISASSRLDLPAASIPAKSIAVLPFEDFSAGKEDVYFADGMQDEILTDLAKVVDLKVISRTSVAQYKRSEPRNLREIAAQLGVANVLEGSVQRAGSKIRVTAQLIDARTDTHLWAEHYDRELADVFAIQSDIAQAIAGQLQVRLSPQEKGAIDRAPTRNLAAYDLYLQAREQRQLYLKVSDDIRRNALREVGLLDQAVALDPAFVLAYCELAKAHDQLYFINPSQTDETLPVDHRSLAEAALAKARRLQPDAGEVHLAQATHFYYTRGDLGQARIEVDLAMRTLPGSAWAKYIAGGIAGLQGDLDALVRFREEAVTLEPRDTYMLDDLARTYRVLRRYADLDRTMARIIAILPPSDATDARFTRAFGILEASGDVVPLRAAVAAAPSNDVDDSDRENIENNRIILAVLLRDANALSRLLAATTQRSGLLLYGVRYPLTYYQALAASMRGDRAGEQSAFTAARAEVEKALLADGNNGLTLSVLAVLDARLGHVEEAVREAKRACELTPFEKSRVNAAAVASNLIVVYAWTQHADLAIEELSKWLHRPVGYGMPFRLSYGDLRLNPFYDPLRGDPRFVALLRQLAPAPGR